MTSSTQPESTSPPDYRDNDQYWVGGVFYVNPNDPRLLVEKRFGVGWTFNFARPIGWWLLIALLALPALLQVVFYILYQNPINLVLLCFFLALCLLVFVAYLRVRASRRL